jgi:endonuclease G
VHHRYQGKGDVDARLSEGSVVQVLSNRKTWRHIAYVASGEAAVGWMTSANLAPCSESGSPEKQKPPSRGKTEHALEASPHLAFGIPHDKDESDDLILDHGVYVVSYNRNLNVPNWVSWKLDASDLGDADRQNNFRSDDDLPGDVFRVAPKDYSKSGYDKGHMCPSAQRTATVETNSLTFLMTNMQPQVHALNGGPWSRLESFERKLADEQNKDVYIVAGGIFDAKPRRTEHKIAIPRANFRITLVLDHGQELSDVTTDTPLYAVEMPNDDTASDHKWTDFRVKVDRIERDTGYDFLSKLPDEVEKRLESTIATAP